MLSISSFMKDEIQVYVVRVWKMFHTSSPLLYEFCFFFPPLRKNGHNDTCIKSVGTEQTYQGA